MSEEEDKLNDKLAWSLETGKREWVKVVPVLSVMQVTGDIYVTGRDTGYELTIKVWLELGKQPREVVTKRCHCVFKYSAS